MTEPWAHAMARVNGVRIHYVVQGSGPLVMLLHGWPQTWYEWRALIPSLAERFTVVAPDLRGYGQSDKPPGGYDKQTMAADVRALARALGHERLRLVGHDRGARVAHRCGLDYPDAVEKVALLDIIPTRALFRRLDASLARGFWHWLFHLQPDLPELLVGPQVEAYLRYFFERWTYQRAAFDAAAIAEYVRAYTAPGALRGGFDDYRATFADDLVQDDASAAAGEKLTMPVLVLWGAMGLVNTIPSVLDIWREYATDVRGGPVADCGHFLPEEQPALVLEHLRAFLEETEA
jgi:haloacetate dehalogenase